MMISNTQFQLAINEAKRVLDTTREPTILSDVAHSYEDKFTVAERLCSTAINLSKAILQQIGVNQAHERKIQEFIANNRQVSLSFKYTNQARFVKETTREQESDTATVFSSTVFSSKQSTVTRITEYFWDVAHEYSIRMYAGPDRDDPNNSLPVFEQSGMAEVITRTKSSPTTEHPSSFSKTVSISPFYEPVFVVDRSHKDCRTPRRNPEVEAILDAFSELARWANSIHNRLRVTTHQFAFSSGDGDSPRSQGLWEAVLASMSEVVLPIAPLGDKKQEVEDGDSVLLDVESEELLHSNFFSKLSECLYRVEEAFNTATVDPEQVKRNLRKQTLFTIPDGKMVVLASLLDQVPSSLRASLDFIESQLRQQVQDAIGKHVTPQDVAEYIAFHYRRVFRNEYAPRPFCFDVRRPGSTPEGSISLEMFKKPCFTFSMARESDPVTQDAPTMRMALNASTDVCIEGKQVAHGMVLHQFGKSSHPVSLELNARARQFSNFILVLGRIVESDRLDPEHALIISNKDSYNIPINLEVIPTAKEFRKAIASLSPEQQAFASAFRKMQLQATLFGICVLPIRPSMEALLALPARSLIKEIKLTQELMTQFIEFQVPSDLLTYSGDDGAPDDSKIRAVRGYAKSVREIIDESREKQLKDRKQEARFARFGSAGSPPGSALPESSGGLFGSSPQAMGFAGSASPTVARFGASASPPKVMFKGNAAFQAEPSALFENRNSLSVGGGGNDVESSHFSSAQASESNAESAVMEAELQQPDQQYGDEPLDPSQPGTKTGFVEIPNMIEHAFDTLDSDSTLRPTTLHPAPEWQKTYREGILGKEQTTSFTNDSQTKSKRETLDLLDALSRSGELTLKGATFHVVVATTQCFDETVMDTLVKGNVNPIEPIERSSLILASVIQQQPAPMLLNKTEHPRVLAHSPMLFNSVVEN